MIVFSILAILGTLLLVLGVGYLYFLVFVALFSREKRYESPGGYDFLILIPAHNEGKRLINTIESLKKVEKPGIARIVVIADNCHDDTAQVAGDQGVEVLERVDPSRKGKGYALEWAMSHFNLNDYNAVVVIDADTIVDKNILEVIAGRLSDGAEAVQLNNIILPQKNKSLAYLQYIANLAENYLFYRPRQTLKLPILLRGTGMVIRSDILKNYPWSSHSVTEDVDYAVNLLRNGRRIDFTVLGAVYSGSTESFGQSFSQRSRWTSGTFALIADHFIPLIKAGFTRGNFKLVELAFSLLLLSRPSMIYWSLLMILFSLLGAGSLLFELITINIVLITLLIIYLLLGAFYGENKKQLFVAILLIPFYGMWYLFVQLRALFGFRKSKWVRTPRNNDD